MLAAIAAAFLAAQPPVAGPLPEAAYLVLSPSERLAADTLRMLAAMDDLGLIRFRAATLPRERYRACLGDEIEVAMDAEACLRRLLPADEAGVPLVTLVVGYTRARGAWQRLQCLGPGGTGEAERIYVAEALHPRADLRARTRDAALACLAPALAQTKRATTP